MRRLLAVCLLACVSLAGAARAHVLVDGAAQAGLDSWAFTGSSLDSGLLSYDAGATDHLFEMYGYLGNASSVLRVVPTYFDEQIPIAGAGATAASRLVLNAAGAAALGLAAGDITLDYAFEIVEATRSFVWDVDVSNGSASTLDLVFYAYADLDIEGDWGNDLADGGLAGFRVSDADTGFELFVGAPMGADHFEVSAWPGLQTALDAMQGAGASDLADSGAPFGPGDFSGALQFDFSLAPGGSQGVGLTLIPEPATVVQLGLGLFGLAIAGSRWHREG
jgi:hypothetical protein